MMKLRITNDFHRVATTVDTEIPLTRRRIKAIRRRLCSGDCVCGDTLGARGPQEDGDAYAAFQERADRVIGTWVEE